MSKVVEEIADNLVNGNILDAAGLLVQDIDLNTRKAIIGMRAARIALQIAQLYPNEAATLLRALERRA